MARLIRPLRQWPQLQHHCCTGTSLDLLLSSPLLPPTITTKSTATSSLSLTSLPASHRNVHQRTRGLRPANAPTTSERPENDTTSDSDTDSDVKKSRNQKKREAWRAVRWGMQIATFSTPQIKRILRVASLDEDVLDALMLVKRLGPDVREGKRRQFNYIGKLLRDVEPELMEALIQATKDGDHSVFQALAGSKMQGTGDEDEDSGETEIEEEAEDSVEHINVATRWFNGLTNKDVDISNEVYSLGSVDFDRQELRKLVKRVVATQERRTVEDGDEGEVDAAILGPKKSLTRFLCTLAKRISVNDV